MFKKVAVILAGGLGTRLRPYTVVLPKPLMPIGEKPILGVIVDQLVRHKFDKAYFMVNHQADIIKAYFGDGANWGIEIEYILETKPLGTMGPLTLIEELPENFILMNGDILTDLSFSKFLTDHTKCKKSFTIAASSREQIIDYGVLETSDGLLSSMTEKPTTKYLVSMGVYAVSRTIQKLLPRDTHFGFDDLMHLCLHKKIEVKVSEHEGYWLDIGRPEDYIKAIEEVERNGGFV